MLSKHHPRHPGHRQPPGTARTVAVLAALAVTGWAGAYLVVPTLFTATATAPSQARNTGSGDIIGLAADVEMRGIDEQQLVPPTPAADASTTTSPDEGADPAPLGYGDTEGGGVAANPDGVTTDIPPPLFTASRVETDSGLTVDLPAGAQLGDRVLPDIAEEIRSGRLQLPRYSDDQRDNRPAALAAAGYENGRLPTDALRPVPGTFGCQLIEPAALAWGLLIDAAAAAGHRLGSISCYRTYEQQEHLRVSACLDDCRFAAPPGRSMHGWGMAVDIGVNGRTLDYTDPEYAWLMATAPAFGLYNPEWARQGGSWAPEPWHWEYVGPTS